MKAAEAQAQVTVLQAKAQSDGMQYTPLRNRSSRLVWSRPRVKKPRIFFQRPTFHVHFVGLGEQLHAIQIGLVQLIQKIIAEKLSDKVQIIMVPSDGKFFFANDLLRGAMPAAVAATHGEPVRNESGSH